MTRAFKTVSAGWLYTTRPDGSGLERLATSPAGIRLFAGASSPDGKAIVFERQRNPGRAIVQIARGGRVVRHGVGIAPTWSSRGLIAYEPRNLEGIYRVCATRPLRASKPVRCFGGRGRSANVPRWSPDGGRLMFNQADGSFERRALDGTIGRHDPDPDPRLFRPIRDVLTGRTLAPVGRLATQKPVFSRLPGPLPDSSRRDRTAPPGAWRLHGGAGLAATAPPLAIVPNAGARFAQESGLASRPTSSATPTRSSSSSPGRCAAQHHPTPARPHAPEERSSRSCAHGARQ